MKIKIDAQGFTYLFEDLTKNERLELVKRLIWSAPDMYDFTNQVTKLLISDKFRGTLD